MSLTHPDSPSDEPDFALVPAPLLRVLQIAGWDGVLPLLVALAPAVVKAIYKNPPVGVGALLVLAPPAAALIRAHIGYHQITIRCGGRAPLWRQVMMALSIVLLLAFEAAVGILTFSDDPAWAWFIPVGIYAGYLAVINVTLWPPRAESAISSAGSLSERT